MASQEITIPDIGTSADVEVIEVLVKVGDKIKKEDSLITLESDKASMEVPSPADGEVAAISIKVGDKVRMGSPILQLKTTATDNKEPASASTEKEQTRTPTAINKSAAESTGTQSKKIPIPDLGTSAKVAVIEINVAVGDSVSKEQTLITLESDKASMEIPAPVDGTIEELHLKVGDKVSSGDLLATMTVQAESTTNTSAATEENISNQTTDSAKPAPELKSAATSTPQPQTLVSNAHIHAGPAVRQFARELGVDLNHVSGTGPKQRILKQDVQAYVKQQLSSKVSNATAIGITATPQIDFSKFGEISSQPLSKINKLTGANLHRNWVTIPHVTQFDEADITDMEEFRKAQKDFADKQGLKLTPLVFLMKAVVAALKAYPRFNASLDHSGENLILKHYYHIGVAVDTPNGLVVAVIREVDQKSLFNLAKELATISEKARTKGLATTDMQGSCFTISSLGGIGGTAFTPIINAPDVAILGVSKAAIKPVYQNNNFVPRLMLPLSLSYDHRVIDGADAARFCNCLSQHLSDIRRLLL